MRQRNWVLLIVPFLISIHNVKCQRMPIAIGAIFENNTFLDESTQMLEYAVEEANSVILRDSGMKLVIATQIIANGREYAVSKSVCDLLGYGVGVVLGPKFASSAFQAMNICDAKEVPYINIYMDEDAASKKAVLNMHPSLDSLTQLALDYANASEWKSLTILYESQWWLKRVANLLEENKQLWNISMNVRSLDYNINGGFMTSLTTVRDSDDRNFILECSTESLAMILRQAMKVGIMTKQYKWILANLDAHTIAPELETYQYSGANITTFRILNIRNEKFDLGSKSNNNEIDDDLFDDPEEAINIDASNKDGQCQADSDNKVKLPMYPDPFNDLVSLRATLIYDAVMTYATALQQLGNDQVVPVKISCDDSGSVWNKGFTIMNFLKSVKYDGLSGRIDFDNAGLRSNITVDILELSDDGLQLIGNWKLGFDRLSNQLNIKRDFSQDTANMDDRTLFNKHLRVITALAEPYTMYKQEAETLTGNERFEGYAIDLIIALSKQLGFTYTFIVEEDKNYGAYNELTNEWDGMVGKVISNEADIAITDLTVTSERIKGLDFTPSILNLGIAILYLEPQKAQPSTFSFMAPFESEVWYLLGGTYFIVSIVFFFLGRLSPSEWENPYPCIEEPTVLENTFSFSNSMWFAAGALLQEGSEIEVKAPSVRIAAAFWWFFTLIMVASYTANLAAFLVVENKSTLVKGVQSFNACGLVSQPECPAKFGAKRGGSTLKFFQHSNYSMYQNMYKVMMSDEKNLLVDENEDGLKKAMTENYAYLMESTTLKYYTERNCNVTQVGPLIDDRNYAIGMRKKYKYYDVLSEGVLKLQEQGVMDRLHTTWWKTKRGGGVCEKEESEEAKSLDVRHLEGVFMILGSGIILAFIYGIGDMIRLVMMRAKKAKVSFRRELKYELKFLWESLKHPNRPKPLRSLKEHASSSQSTYTAGRSNTT